MGGPLQRLRASYRFRLLFGYVLVVGVLAGAWVWSLYNPVTSAVSDQQSQRLHALSRAAAVAMEQPDADIGVLARELVAGGPIRLTVVGPDGSVIADSQADTTTMENHSARPEIAAALEGRTGEAVRRSETLTTKQLYVAVPATIQGRSAAVRTSEQLVTIAQIASQARERGLIMLAVALLLAALVAWRLTASAAWPVGRLAAAARSMAGGDLFAIIDDAPGELGVVSEALRELAAQTRGRIAALHAEQASLRAVLDGLPDAVFLLEKGVVAIANDAASRMFDAPQGGWDGRVLGEDMLPASLGASIRELMTTPEPVTEEIGPDPTLRWLRVTAVPLSAAGGGERVLIIVADITERMRLDKVRTDFVANASHELKTPTAAIQLLADSATSASEDGDVPQALHFVRQLRQESGRLRSLVLDLLDLSRLETAPEPGTITNLRAAIDLSIIAHSSAARAKGLGLASDYSAVAGEDAYAQADPTDVAVALDNLLDNGVAYTDSGTVIVSLALTPTSVLVTVRDTGIGIPEADLPRVFERFYRVDRSRARASGGTGLGLSLVRHVVERSGGRVSVESQLGTGTAVIVTLPRSFTP